MAAYINRTISLVAGNSHSAVDSHTNGVAVVDTRDSPLQIFVKAKKKINDIFVEIEAYLKDAVVYTQIQKQNGKVISEEEAAQVEGFVNKVRGIRDVLSRDHMKVVFFGRTSNGKSTVINAMLHDKILPSGIGHTTNCFLQVEGSENGESYLVTEDSNERRNVQSVGQLAHALCKEKLCESQLVRVFWPKDKCLLLRDDVVLVDSPGIDVSPNLDEWIDRHCLDADVFCLVANAESTLMLTEKNFFHKVSTRLSKPNIFILNNRWDASANEPDFLDQVRAQHLERAMDFLVKELKVCTAKEAQDRIFFVSAKEALQVRLQEAKGQISDSRGLAEGFQIRYFEFTNFERKFEECISKSAVKTKFEQHAQRGRHIATEMASLLEGIYERAQSKRDDRLTEKRELQERLNYTDQQLIVLTKKMKDKIQRMVEEVEQKVSTALSEEIRRLSVLVDEFSVSFHPDPLVLNIYKRELHSHVENGLGSNLRARLSTALAMNIEASQREMTDNMAQLLPEKKRNLANSLALPRREPFEILYRLNCDNLCADFREDLEFRFSWGLTSLIQRFANFSKDKRENGNIRKFNYSNHRLTTDLSQGENGHPSTSYSTSLDSTPQCSTLGSFAQDLSFPSKMAIATIGSQGTMGGLLIAGFLLKTVGWRVIAATGAIYGCVYFYERLTWTTKAKERALKQQYVAHATKKLRLIVDLTSANCSHQVQQELSSTFARLCQLLDEESADMVSEVKKLELEVKELEEAANSARLLKNKATYVDKELQLFDDAYLKAYR